MPRIIKLILIPEFLVKLQKLSKLRQLGRSTAGPTHVDYSSSQPTPISEVFSTLFVSFPSYRKSVRATFILLPLLGGAYFLFIHQPRVDTVFHDVYGYFQVTLQSLQGFFVALFYVYTNQEVRKLVLN